MMTRGRRSTAWIRALGKAGWLGAALTVAALLLLPAAARAKEVAADAQDLAAGARSLAAEAKALAAEVQKPATEGNAPAAQAEGLLAEAKVLLAEAKILLAEAKIAEASSAKPPAAAEKAAATEAKPAAVQPQPPAAQQKSATAEAQDPATPPAAAASPTSPPAAEGAALPGETAVPTAAAEVAAARADRDQGPAMLVPPLQKEGLRHWRLSAGVQARTVREIRLRPGAAATAAAVPLQSAFRPAGSPANVGPAGAAADRAYDDGFVNQDLATPLDGSTWYWGYRNAAQAQNGQLVFSAADRETVSPSRHTTLTAAPESESDDTAAMPFLEANYVFAVKSHAACGIQLGLAYFSVSSSASASTLRDVQDSSLWTHSVQDRYDLLGVVPPPPPYSGTLLGPGPVIPNVPASRSVISSRKASDVYASYNTLVEDLDADVTSLYLGATGEKRWGRVALGASAGPSLNLASTDVSHNETLYGSRNGAPAEPVQQWRYHEDDTDVKLGVYAQASAGLQLTPRVQANLIGRYDWCDRISGRIGPSSYDLDLSGVSVGGSVGVDW
jgi:hypothetical protein